MTSHNTFTASKGKIVIHGVWGGSSYTEYQAFIKAIVAIPTHPDHATINLAYSDGIGGANQANNVKNIELITGNEDYWRAQYDPRLNDSHPQTNVRPTQGEVVWLAKYDTTDQEHHFFLAFVRAIPGNPNDPSPNVNLTYYDLRPSVDNDVNENQVIPYSEATATDTHWFNKKAI